MKSVKVKINNYNKKVKVPDAYKDLIKSLSNQLEGVKRKYVFLYSIANRQECFYDEETFIQFKQTEGINAQTVNLEFREVDDYPIKQMKEEENAENEENEEDLSQRSDEEDHAQEKVNLEPLKALLNKSIKENIESLKNSLIMNKEDLENCKAAYDKRKGTKIANEFNQPNVICSQCFNNKCKGNIFICSECSKYALCSQCEDRNDHNIEHNFIMVPTVIDDSFHKLNCIMNKNTRYLCSHLSGTTFDQNIEISLINNGEMTWSNCYLQSVTFGDYYLNGPRVKIPEVNLKEKIDVNLVITSNRMGKFQSKWRLFNNYGIPFGPLLLIEILIE